MKTLSINRYIQLLLVASITLLLACSNEPEESQNQEEMLIEQDSVAEVLEEVDTQRDTLTGNWINADFLA